MITLDDGLKLEFSSAVQEKWGEISRRPSGEIELLIGADVASMHPRFLECSGQLIVKHCPVFGQEMLLWGAHPSIAIRKVNLSEEVNAIRLGSYARINKLGITYTQDKDFEEIPSRELLNEMDDKCVNIAKTTQADFWEAEGLGCEAPRRCKTCRGCREC